jgi:prepilin-type N-terminal cleavage/methylation domain-containing protein
MRRNQKGFTLMELMVVIVIVAILAAVAVPLYINYVKDAQRTEAKGAIGAVITAEQAFYQKSGTLGTPTYAADLPTLKASNALDLTEPEVKWTFTAAGDANGFTVHAVNKADVTLIEDYAYTRTGGGTFTP